MRGSLVLLLFILNFSAGVQARDDAPTPVRGPHNAVGMSRIRMACLSAFYGDQVPANIRDRGESSAVEEHMSVPVQTRVEGNLFQTNWSFDAIARNFMGSSELAAGQLYNYIRGRMSLPGALWLDEGAGSGIFQIEFLNRATQQGHELNLQRHSILSTSFAIPRDAMDSIDAAISRYSGTFYYHETGDFLEWADRGFDLPFRDSSGLNGRVTFFTAHLAGNAYIANIERYYNAVADVLAVGGEGLLFNEASSLRRITVDGVEVSRHDLPHWIEVLSGGRLIVDYRFAGRVLVVRKVSAESLPVNYTSETVIVENNTPPVMELHIRRKTNH